MIDRIEIDTDEDGFVLIVDGDFLVECEEYVKDPPNVETLNLLNLRLPQDAALALLREVDEKIRPWADEGEAVRREVERGGSICGHDGWVSGCPTCEAEAAQAGELIDPSEAARDRADLDRKRERENR